MSEIKKNPPASVVSEQHLLQYNTLYDDIADNGTVLRYDDRHMLGELAVTLVEMAECREDIARNGRMLTVQGDRNEVTKKNPSVDILLKLQVHVKALFKEFNMSPNTRGKTSVGIESANTDDGFGGV